MSVALVFRATDAASNAVNSNSMNWAITASDPDAAFVKLLMHMEGGAFVDSSLVGQTFAAPVGTAALSSAQAKFGTQSVALVNNTDTIQTVATANQAFGGAATSWCLEFWVRFTSVASGIYFFVWTDSTTNVWFQFTSAGIFKARVAAQDLPGLTSVVVNQWYFVRLNRDGSSPGLNFFIDGVKQSGPFASANTMTGSAKVCVGGNAATTGANTQGRCYIDEVQLTLGSARTASNNTVPTAAFPNP